LRAIPKERDNARLLRVETLSIDRNQYGHHQQPEANYLPRFGPQLISLGYGSHHIASDTMQSFREVNALETGPLPRGGHRGHHYRGTSLIRNTPLLGPYSRTIPRVLGWFWGGGAVSYERGTPVGITFRGEKQEFRIGKIIFRAVVRRCGPSVWGLRTIGRRMIGTGLYEGGIENRPLLVQILRRFWTGSSGL